MSDEIILFLIGVAFVIILVAHERLSAYLRFRRWKRHMIRPRDPREVAIDEAYRKQIEEASRRYFDRETQALREAEDQVHAAAVKWNDEHQEREE